MKTIVHRAGSRGHANHGWLQTWHTFSFANYYNPDRVHFGALRVLNDDIIQPAMGFGTHPHDNMEIITIIIKGALEHKDSMGNGSLIREGEVQVMSAGSGVYHSEFNPSGSEEVNLLQIWVFPDTQNVEPRYDQALFQEETMNGKWKNIVSPDGNDGSLWIHQQAWFSLGEFAGNEKVVYRLHKPENGLYLFVIEGEVDIAGQRLDRRDGIGIFDPDQEISIFSREKAKLLVIEVPVRF